MDPQQRLVLEVGYAALHGSGQQRSALAGSNVGLFIAIEHVDWQLMQALRASRTALQRASAYGASGEQPHVASGRLAFALDLRGPIASINTACSSALVAVHHSAAAIRTAECPSALAAGVKVVLLPFGVDGGVVALDGRSKSFDARADGYGRSEAIAATRLDASGEALTALAGSSVHASGRGASLTAPNGSAQGVAMELALARGSLSASEVGCVQPQGLGSALADPIEMRAVTTVLGTNRLSALAIGCHKANAGHSEAPSGLMGLLVAQHAVQQLQLGTNAQLRALNPLVAQPMRQAALPAALPTNGLAMHGIDACGVAAFGVSGVIANAVVRAVEGARMAMAAVLAPTPRVAYHHQRAFVWREPTPPLAQRLLPSSDGAEVFRSSAAGALHSLVADHIVQGRVIFPATGYLEMARAAASQASMLPALHGVYFLQPLAVETAGLHVECAMSGGRFDVRSGALSAVSESLTDAMVHCSGSIERGSLAPQQQVDYAAMRGVCCPLVADIRALYAALHSIGLQYGPGYRTLTHTWASSGVVASARLRARLVRRGAQVHPADLDDALCLGGLASSDSSDGETRLPFAVEHAKLCGAAGKLWAVRCHGHGLPARVSSLPSAMLPHAHSHNPCRMGCGRW